MREETIEIGGNPFYLRIHGADHAPPIVFLHGFPEYSSAWDDLGARLSDEFRCIAPDLRGYGQSWQPDDERAYRVGPMMPDLRGLLEYAGDGAPVNLVAHDWGAALAYVGVAAMPQLVRRFTVLNGVHPVPFQQELASGGPQAEASQYITWLRRPGSEEALAKDDFALLDRMLTDSADGSWFTPERRNAYHAAWSARPGTLKTMVNWYRASPMSIPEPGQGLPKDAQIEIDTSDMRITMPHLIIWGDADTALMPETRDGVAPLCDDLRIETVPGTDHWLHHQKPDDVAGHLRAFFAV